MTGADMKTVSSITLTLAAAALLLFAAPRAAHAQTDCLGCHGDSSMQDASGHSISVDGDKFHSSIHGVLKCNDCHITIKEYPHPDKIEAVKCETCHADEATGLAGSVHSNRPEHPCTSCLGNARQRLALACGDAARLALVRAAGGGCRAELSLPYRTERTDRPVPKEDR